MDRYGFQLPMVFIKDDRLCWYLGRRLHPKEYIPENRTNNSQPKETLTNIYSFLQVINPYAVNDATAKKYTKIITLSNRKRNISYLLLLFSQPVYCLHKNGKHPLLRVMEVSNTTLHTKKHFHPMKTINYFLTTSSGKKDGKNRGLAACGSNLNLMAACAS